MAVGVRNSTYFEANGSIRESTNSNQQWFGESGSIKDFVTPNFKALVRSGKIVNNPLEQLSTLRQLVTTTWQSTHPDGSKWVFSGTDSLGSWNPFTQPSADAYFGTPSEVGIDDNQLSNLASLNALANVSSASTLVGVTVVEARKTIGTILGTAGGLAKGIQSLLQGSSKKAVLQALLGSAYKEQRRHNSKWAAKSVAKKWLEVRYGWVPMLYDLEGTLAALNAIHYPRFTARGYANKDGSTTTLGNTSVDPFWGHTFDWKATQTYDSKARAYVLYSVDENWFRAHKLGALCTLQTAWELVPFSFVVDWFVDIGQWLQAIEPRAGIKTLSTGVAVRNVYKRTSLVTAVHATGGALIGLVGLNDLYQTKRTSRVTELSLALRPYFDVKINVKRAIDSIALFVQQASKAR